MFYELQAKFAKLFANQTQVDSFIPNGVTDSKIQLTEVLIIPYPIQNEKSFGLQYTLIGEHVPFTPLML